MRRDYFGYLLFVCDNNDECMVDKFSRANHCNTKLLYTTIFEGEPSIAERKLLVQYHSRYKNYYSCRLFDSNKYVQIVGFSACVFCGTGALSWGPRVHASSRLPAKPCGDQNTTDSTYSKIYCGWWCGVHSCHEEARKLKPHVCPTLSKKIVSG